jgi:hypothetical protein
LAKTGPVVTGSRKQVRPHSLLRVDGELRGEVRRGFEKLGLMGGMRGTIALTPQGASAAAGKGGEMLRAAPGQFGTALAAGAGPRTPSNGRVPISARVRAGQACLHFCRLEAVDPQPFG